ncbi:hypothetical protein JVU11DRAFT_220 [Chiua virens]|nr:hypothetical protein JVU11DRAFT_220 [Chiua virens]
MRRRGPPSTLHLFQGPLPPRSHPKHTLPSLPHPVFRPEGSLSRDPCSLPRARQAVPDHIISPLALELAAICRSSGSTPNSPNKRRRGPWDDSACFEVTVDVDSILAPPKPVAMGL